VQQLPALRHRVRAHEYALLNARELALEVCHLLSSRKRFRALRFCPAQLLQV
jgi:hypothetical protein